MSALATGWWARTTPEREADQGAADEIERRGLPETRTTVERPDPEPPAMVPEEAQAQRDAERASFEASRERLREAVAQSEQRRAVREQELARAQEQARLAAVEAQAQQRERSRAAMAELDYDLELRRSWEQVREASPAHRLVMQRERDADLGMERE